MGHYVYFTEQDAKIKGNHQVCTGPRKLYSRNNVFLMSSFWTVEAEQEGLVRGHVPRGLHLLGLDTAVHLLDLDMMDHVIQLRIAPSLILSL